MPPDLPDGIEIYEYYNRANPEGAIVFLILLAMVIAIEISRAKK